MPDRHRGSGDRKKTRRHLLRGRKSVPVERAPEPVTRWFGSASLPGREVVVAPPPPRANEPRIVARPQPGAEPHRAGVPAAPRPQAPVITTPARPTPRGSLPPEYRRVVEGRLPPDYPAVPERPRVPPVPTAVALDPRLVAVAPPVAPEPTIPRRSHRRKAGARAPAAPPPRGRHRLKGKPWSAAPKRRRRAPRRPSLRLPTSGLIGRLGIGLLVAAVLVGAVVGVRSLGKDGDPKEGKIGAGLAQAPVTTLFVGTDIGGARAVWLALLSYDPVQDKGAIVYVPAHTAVEIPGRGLQGMGGAVETGGLPLLLVSAESYFGIEIDNYLEVPRSGAETLFEALGPLTVDVPSEVAISEGNDTQRLLLSEGRQELGPFQLADLLYTIGADGDDVELGARHLAFWHALAETFVTAPGTVRTAFRALEETSDDDPSSSADNSDLVASLASLAGSDLTLAILPVQQVSVGGAELYSTDSIEIAEFVLDTLPGVTVAAGQARVQVLNGNGVPGIGQEVAERLVGRGFRIVLSGNADSFEYNTTKVIAYDSSPEGQALAVKARDLLGAGEVQVSGQGQGSVDLTIIVGKDFLRTP